ncbi:MAG: hypothetical protein V3R25_08590 [Nitrosomonadaceae bacterium]
MKYLFLATVLVALIVTFLAYNKLTAESILILKPMGRLSLLIGMFQRNIMAKRTKRPLDLYR